MPDLTAADAASRARKGWVKAADEDEDDDAKQMTRGVNGRRRASRALYNATRGDSMGEMLMGRQASEKQLQRLMKMDADEAEEIDRAVPRRRKSPLYDHADKED